MICGEGLSSHSTSEWQSLWPRGCCCRAERRARGIWAVLISHPSRYWGSDLLTLRAAPPASKACGHRRDTVEAPCLLFYYTWALRPHGFAHQEPSPQLACRVMEGSPVNAVGAVIIPHMAVSTAQRYKASRSPTDEGLMIHWEPSPRLALHRGSCIWW